MIGKGTLSKGPGPGASVTPVAWVVDGDLEIGEWVAAGRKFGVMGRCSNWWLGDWIRYGNTKFGERYARAAVITGYDSQSLMNMVWVASRFEFSRRRENLTWSHHEAVAPLEEDEQEKWLGHAIEERLSVADLRLEIRTARKLVAVGAQPEEDADPGDGTEICPQCGQVMQQTPKDLSPP